MLQVVPEIEAGPQLGEGQMGAEEFCDHCQIEFEDCPHCGSLAKKGAEKCPSCGAELPQA